MMPRIIRNRRKSHQPQKEIAAAIGESLQDAVDQSVEDCRRIYLGGVNADYAALNRNPRAMAEFKRRVPPGMSPTLTD